MDQLPSWEQIRDKFLEGATAYPALAAHWDSTQWTLRDKQVSEAIKAANPEAERLFIDTARLPVILLGRSREEQPSWHTWLDLMRKEKRGFRPAFNPRGGGATSGCGRIDRVFAQSVDFCADLAARAIEPALPVTLAAEEAKPFAKQPADSQPRTTSQIGGEAAVPKSPGEPAQGTVAGAPSGEPSGLVSEDQIRELLTKQGVSPDQVTYADVEQALREYRRLHPDAKFPPELHSILAYSDFARRNRALFEEKWNEAKLLVADPQQWHDLAAQFEALAARESEAVQHYKRRLVIDGDHLNCRWTSHPEDEISLRFDVLAAEGGRRLGASPEIQQAIRQTNAESWADFWKYCLWFYLGDTDKSTLANPIKDSVNFCLRLALHSQSVEDRDNAAVGVAERKAEPMDAARPLVPKFLGNARAKVRAVAKALASDAQTLDEAATALELEARTWGQDLHNAILEKAALEGLPPEQFEKRATESAKEIVMMAANEFSVRRGADTTNGVTPFLIGRTPAVVQSDRPPEINTWGSIVQYLRKTLADYPQEYRRDNLSVYKLTHGAESVTDEKCKSPVPLPAVMGSITSEPGGGVNEQSVVGSGHLSREERLQAFIAEHAGTTLADIKFSARVHTPEFQDWRNYRIEQKSVMSERIEDVLRGTAPLKKRPRKRRAE
jgi:hypothetical protein